MVHASKILGTVALMATTALAKEKPVDIQKSNSIYKSGKMHNSIMEKKRATWAEAREAGAFDSEKHPELHYTKCVDGYAEAIEGDDAYTFKCQNADLVHFLSHADLGAPQAAGSSSWGFLDAHSSEFGETGTLPSQSV